MEIYYIILFFITLLSILTLIYIIYKIFLQQKLHSQEVSSQQKLHSLKVLSQQPVITNKGPTTTGQATSNITDWSHLVGVDVNEAYKIIKNQRPDLKLNIVSYNAIITTDYIDDRVIIFETLDHKVEKVPKIG